MDVTIKLDGVQEGQKYLVEVCINKGNVVRKKGSDLSQDDTPENKDNPITSKKVSSIDDFEKDELAQLNKESMGDIKSNIKL